MFHVNCPSGFKSVLLLEGRSMEGWPCSSSVSPGRYLAPLTMKPLILGCLLGCKVQPCGAGSEGSGAEWHLSLWARWVFWLEVTGKLQLLPVALLCARSGRLLLWTTGGRRSCALLRRPRGRKVQGRVEGWLLWMEVQQQMTLYFFLTLSVKVYVWEEAVVWKWCNFSKCYFGVLSENTEQQDMYIQSSFSYCQTVRKTHSEG